MANTYTQIYLHVIFATKNRGCAITKDWRSRLHEYIGGILRNYKCASIIVGGIEDHVHILLSLNKNIRIPDLVGEIKSSATNWINHNDFFRGHFEWQDGYGAFSVSPSLIDKTKQYIANQDVHHRRTSFQEEFIGFLKAYGINYDPKYLPYNPLDVVDNP